MIYPKAKVVGVSPSPIRYGPKGDPYPISYTEIKFDKDEKVDPNKFLPEPFDLVTVISDKGNEYSAWWTGSKWHSRKLLNDEKVIFWKRIIQEVKDGKEMDTGSYKTPWGFKSIFEDAEGEGHFSF